MAERHFNKRSGERERRLIAQSDAPLGAFRLYENRDAPELFVDGVGEMSIGPSVCKLKFFTVKSAEMVNGAAVEEREISFVLTVPSVALMEWIAGFGPTLEPHIPIIERAAETTVSNLKKLVLRK